MILTQDSFGASADQAAAATVAEALRHGGHNVFLDSDRNDGIAPGDVWSRTLFHELRVCDAVLFLNSTASQGSKWCHTELAVAGDLGKRTYWLDLAARLEPHPIVQSVHGIRFGTSLGESTEVRDVYRVAAERGANIRRLNYRRDSLEDIFLKAMENGATPPPLPGAGNGV